MISFDNLIDRVGQLHIELQQYAVNSVNQALTLRNILIGFYIVEYEQKGSDRAAYGSKLLKNISDKLSIKGLSAPELSRFRQFYVCYPQILGTLSQELKGLVSKEILGSVTQELNSSDHENILGSLTQELESSSGESHDLFLEPRKLVEKLSFTHFVELIKIADDLKRTFYELECIKGTWSVRELKRQISSLYYERSGFSSNPEKISELLQQETTPQTPADIIKNIYTFDFLEVGTHELVEESDLEKALLSQLQNFIIELGNGFCFETRQKRILIGENYYFLDLVFYHRVLKCHVLIELKLGAFNHGDIGQLNTYLNYFKEEICLKDDNPPIGILMVAEKDHALVKYATAGMDENLFVQQYLVQLPSVEQLEKYIMTELKEFNK